MGTEQAYRTHYSMYWLCILLALLTVPANALEIPAKPPSHVVDLADVIDPAHEAMINRHLLDLGQKSIATIVVLTVDTTGDESIDEYSLRIANDKWQLGDKEKNNGLLILAAVQDRRWRIEVGLGLEETLPNDFCREIGEQYFVPNFRTGDFGKGIYEGVLALTNKIAQDYASPAGDLELVSSVKYIKAHDAPVRSLAISPDKKVLVSGDDQGTIVFWSLPDLCKLKTISLDESHIRCVAFSSNGRYLYAPGGSHYDIVEIDMTDFSMRRLSIGAMGSVLAVCPSQDGTKLATVTASNELLVNELQPRRPDETQIVLRSTRERKIFGGFIREAVFSDNKRFVAITSQNEIDNYSAPPQKLTIFDLKGKAETSYTFKSSVFDPGSAYSSSTICFSADSRTLWLHTYVPVIRAFEFDENKQEWSMKEIEKDGSKVYCTASCTDSQRDTVFLAGGEGFDSGGNIYGWDSSKRLRELASLSVGEGGEYASDKIEDLLWIPNPPRLVAALQDGRVAIMTLEKGVPADLDNKVVIAMVKDITLLEESGTEICRLWLGLELPQRAVSVRIGQIRSAITDTGRSLLPGDQSPPHQRAFYPPRLGQDGDICEFKIDLSAPKQEEQSLKQVLGELEYATASKWRTQDAGLIELAAGAKSKHGKIVIHSASSETDSTFVALEIGFPSSAIRSVRFYREDGSELDSHMIPLPASPPMAVKTIMPFSIEGAFPSKVRMELDVFENPQKHKVLFRANDISFRLARLGIDEETGFLIAKPIRFSLGIDLQMLMLTTRLPHPALGVLGVTIDKLLTPDGNILWPEGEWVVKMDNVSLEGDGKTVELSIGFDGPSKEKKEISKLFGTLEYLDLRETSQVDSGIIDFAANTWIEEAGVEIESIDGNRITLKSPHPRLPIQSATFYTEDGRKLRTSPDNRFGIPGSYWELRFIVKEELPSKGRIVLEIPTNTKKRKIAFIAENIIIERSKYFSDKKR